MLSMERDPWKSAIVFAHVSNGEARQDVDHFIWVQ